MTTNQKGSGLIFATILLFVILSMVISLSSITVMETKMSQKNKSSVGAFYNSESGIEWALNKIANTPDGDSAHTAFTGFINVGSGEVSCPDFGSGSPCKVYLLDKDGNIMKNADLNQDVSEVKAVRAVGSESVGDTSRAIEAAVGASEGKPGNWTCELTTGPSAGANVTSTATCNAPKKLIAGGCGTGGQDLVHDRPGDNSWVCHNQMQSTGRAYAWCCE